MLDSMSAWVLRYGEAAAAGEPAAAEALPAEPAPGLLTAGLPDVRAEPAETQVRWTAWCHYLEKLEMRRCMKFLLASIAVSLPTTCMLMCLKISGIRGHFPQIRWRRRNVRCARAQATVPDMWMALVKALARLSTHPQEHIRAQALVILQRCVWPHDPRLHSRTTSLQLTLNRGNCFRITTKLAFPLSCKTYMLASVNLALLARALESMFLVVQSLC